MCCKHLVQYGIYRQFNAIREIFSAIQRKQKAPIDSMGGFCIPMRHGSLKRLRYLEWPSSMLFQSEIANELGETDRGMKTTNKEFLSMEFPCTRK